MIKYPIPNPHVLYNYNSPSYVDIIDMFARNTGTKIDSPPNCYSWSNQPSGQTFVQESRRDASGRQSIGDWPRDGTLCIREDPRST